MIDLKCKICGKECGAKNGLFLHLSMKHGIKTQEYYDKFYFKDGDDICQMEGCDNKTQFNKKIFGYKKTCAICNSKGQTKDWYIAKYGKEIGLEKYNNRRKNISKSKKGVLNKEWYINRYGEEEGNKLYEERCNLLSFRNTLDGSIDLHGKEEGTEKYNKRCERISDIVRGKEGLTLEWYIRKHGKEEGTEKYNKRCESVSKGRMGVLTLEWFIEKNNGDIEKAKEENIKKKIIKVKIQKKILLKDMVKKKALKDMKNIVKIQHKI